MIDAETKGAIKWKLVPGSQLADAKATFTAVKDGLMHAGLGIVTYVPNAIPSVYAIYSTIIFGDNDPVAATLGGARDDVSPLPVLHRGGEEIQCRAARRLGVVVLRAGLLARRSRRSPNSRASACARPAAMPTC